MSSEYADVTVKFHELSSLTADTPEYVALREQIVQQCLPLADHIARRFNNRGEAHDDLVQVARIGLLNAVNRFDVQTGSEFMAFAVPTIMGEVRRHFRDHGWAVKVPRRLKELHLRIGSATAEMSQRLGRAPTASELAAELGEDREEIVQGLIVGSSYTTRSIDAGRDDDTPFLAASLGERDSALDRIEDREAIRPALAKLPEREREVLRLRFFESMTQTQIAERVGISQMHVSRLLARSLTALRQELDISD
ncbi:SigB/SigF/SigG family RNA polymerase sigma factor [Mycobacterium sp. C31M]